MQRPYCRPPWQKESKYMPCHRHQVKLSDRFCASRIVIFTVKASRGTLKSGLLFSACTRSRQMGPGNMTQGWCKNYSKRWKGARFRCVKAGGPDSRSSWGQIGPASGSALRLGSEAAEAGNNGASAPNAQLLGLARRRCSSFSHVAGRVIRWHKGP